MGGWDCRCDLVGHYVLGMDGKRRDGKVVKVDCGCAIKPSSTYDVPKTRPRAG
jgi:hypothetical protein